MTIRNLFKDSKSYTLNKVKKSKGKGITMMRKDDLKKTEWGKNWLKKLKNEMPSKGGLTPTKGYWKRENSGSEGSPYWGGRSLAFSTFLAEPTMIRSIYKRVGVVKGRLLFTTLKVPDDDNDVATGREEALKPGCWIRCKDELYELLRAMYELMPIHELSLGPEDGQVRWPIECVTANKSAFNSFAIGWFKEGCLTAIRRFYRDSSSADLADPWRHSPAGLCVSSEELATLLHKLPGLFLMAYPATPIPVKKTARAIANRIRGELKVEGGMAEVEMATQTMLESPGFLEDIVGSTVPDLPCSGVEEVCRRLRTGESFFLKNLVGIEMVKLRQQQAKSTPRSKLYTLLSKQGLEMLKKAKADYMNDSSTHLRNGKLLRSNENLYAGEEFDSEVEEEEEAMTIDSSATTNDIGEKEDSSSFLLSDDGMTNLSDIETQDLFGFLDPKKKKTSSTVGEISTQDILEANRDIEENRLEGLTQIMTPSSDESKMDVDPQDTSVSMMSVQEGGAEPKRKKSKILSSSDEEGGKENKREEEDEDDDFDPEAETQPLIQDTPVLRKTNDISKIKGVARVRLTRRKAAEQARIYLPDSESEDDKDGEEWLGEEGRKKKERKQGLINLQKLRKSKQEAKEKKKLANDFIWN